LRNSSREPSSQRSLRQAAFRAGDPSVADKGVADPRESVLVRVVRSETCTVEGAAGEPDASRQRGARTETLASARRGRGLSVDERRETAHLDQKLADDALGAWPDERILKRNHGVGQQVWLPEAKVSSHALVFVVAVDPEERDGPRPFGRLSAPTLRPRSPCARGARPARGSPAGSCVVSPSARKCVPVWGWIATTRAPGPPSRPPRARSWISHASYRSRRCNRRDLLRRPGDREAGPRSARAIPRPAWRCVPRPPEGDAAQLQEGESSPSEACPPSVTPCRPPVNVRDPSAVGGALDAHCTFSQDS
jgi:hypothetical protein